MLWRLNNPALHIHIPRDAMDNWMNWGLQLAEGSSYFASAMRHVQIMMQHHPLRNALQQMAPAIADPEGDWLNDQEQQANALYQMIA